MGTNKNTATITFFALATDQLLRLGLLDRLVCVCVCVDVDVD